MRILTTFLSFVLLIASPVLAEETQTYSGTNDPAQITKGTKAYQKKQPNDQTAAANDAVNPSDIEPAAGEIVDEGNAGEAFHETLRLPRKN